MTLQDIIQIKQDRINGVVLCRDTIDRMISHALMREAEAPHLYERIEQQRAEIAQLKAQLQLKP